MKSGKGLNEQLGSVLRAARLEAQLSQEELAFRAGLHRTYVSLIERGIKSPTLETFFRICAALGFQPDVLISRLKIPI